MQEALSIAVVDRDKLTLQRVTEAMAELLSVIVPCPSAEALFDLTLQNKAIGVVVFELEKPFDKAFDLISEIRSKSPRTEIVFVSRFDDEELWIEAIQRGAYDYLPKPLDVSELKRVLLNAAEKHQSVPLRKRPPANSAKAKSAKEKAS